MAKQEAEPGVVQRAQNFFTEVRAEMTKVAWPSKEEVKASTSVVLLMLGILAAIVGVMDIVFRTVVVSLLRLT